MPHIYDFKNCIGKIKETTVNPKGWNGPITIEYGIAQHNKYDPMLSVVWRIKGTTHVFSIYERRLNVISHSNYDEHFTQALENFREDYLSWFRDKEYDGVEWKYEYKNQYERLIQPESEGEFNESYGDQNNESEN